MKLRINHVIIWVAALAVTACALLLYEKFFLWKVQEMNLFQSTPLFFRQEMVVPGGFLSYVATYLTQYLHYPWLGVLMLMLCWLLLMWLTKRAFRIPDKWAMLMLIPVVLLLLTIVDMGYWVYILKLHGHFFVATLGALFVAALLWAFRCLPQKYHLRAVFIVMTAVVGFPLAGIYGIAATLLMGIFTWRLESKGRSAVYCILALLMAIAIPLVYYRYVYHETNLANIYWAELPLFFIQENYHNYYIPYYLLALFYAIVAITYKSDRSDKSDKSDRSDRSDRSDKSDKSGKAKKVVKAKSGEKSGKRWMWIAGQAAIIAILVAAVVKFWYKDENFHRELAMQYAVEQLDWEGVLKEAAQQQDEPTRAIWMMKNLALGRLGRQGSDMYYYRNGSKQSNAPFMMRLMQVIGPMIYYQYGMLNYCTRLSTEMGVEYGWRPEYLKNLTRCALLNREWQVARKYIHELKQTTFFDDWAAHAESLIGKPAEIAKEPEMEPITHMMHFENILSADQGFVEKFLMKELAYRHEVNDPIFQEQALLASLWTKNPKEFWYHFAHYTMAHPNTQIPIHYQEAAYLYAVMEGRPEAEKAPFSPGVKESYNKFVELSSKYNGMDLEEVREILRPTFGHTYYYDYFLMYNLPEY